MEIGIERELLLFNQELKPVNVFEQDLPKNVVLDFADNQLEIVTDVFDCVDKVYSNLNEIMLDDIFTQNVIWPFSMPPKRDFAISIIGTDSKQKQDYRAHLKNKYNNDLLLISGIHVNVSFQDYIDQNKLDSENFYFDLMKKVYYFGPLLLQFCGFSPKCDNENLQLDINYDDVLSIRNTKYGYYNEHLLDLDFSSKQNFSASIDAAISAKKIDSAKELYSKVRFKTNNKINYLELRFFDVNPYEKSGISQNQLFLLSAFLKYLISIELKEFDFLKAIENFDLVALKGLNREVKYQDSTLRLKTIELLNSILNLELSTNENNTVKLYLEKYLKNDLLIDQFIDNLKTTTPTALGKKMAFKKEEFVELFGELKMELSTKILIKEAQKQGYKVDILDETTNVIEISNQVKSEIVFRATETSLDSYNSVLIMNNKFLTKYALSKPSQFSIVNTPKSFKYHKDDEVDYAIFKSKKMVVKPLDTNFGDGITILSSNPSQAEIMASLKLAFECSDVILVEEFFTGIEYRFLVIDYEVVSVINRVAANVIGDGVHSITQLVANKNASSLRGKGYVRPLEYINLGNFEKNYLNAQGLNVDSVVAKNETVYLRENSNVSTGGDTIEVFDVINPYYKEQASIAAKRLGVKICGIDMIISDNYNCDQNYTIIEANYNPAIQMHTYPLKGYGVNVASSIIKALFKDDNVKS